MVLLVIELYPPRALVDVTVKLKLRPVVPGRPQGHRIRHVHYGAIHGLPLRLDPRVEHVALILQPQQTLYIFVGVLSGIVRVELSICHVLVRAPRDTTVLVIPVRLASLVLVGHLRQHSIRSRIVPATPLVGYTPRHHGVRPGGHIRWHDTLVHGWVDIGLLYSTSP